MRTGFIQQSALIALTTVVLSTSGSAIAAGESNTDPLTKQAISLFKEGKVQQATEIQEKIVKEQPESWLQHATMSYFYWQQGNAPDAIVEGQKAIRLAPHNAVALNNLADIYQLLGAYPDAIPLYDGARKAAPDNWVPWVCLARCYVNLGQADKALEVLKEMAALKSESFPWHFQLGETYLTINKPELAVAPLTLAVSSATLPEQKEASLTQLLVALLRDNQLERAKPVKDQLISGFHPSGSEPYVRAASALYPSLYPTQGKELLKVTSGNLKSIKDSEGFFRLGRIFETKADEASNNATTCDAWLDNAQAAFTKAIELNPALSKNHLALAAIFQRKGNMEEMAKELTEAMACDRSDPVAPYLRARTSCPPNSSKQSNESRSGKTSRKTGALALTAVNFTVSGLSCGCHAGKIEAALNGIDGVTVANFFRAKPYPGTILVDQSITPVDKVFALVPEKTLADGSALKILAPDMKFEITSQQPVGSFTEAVRVAQNAQYGSVLDFPKTFDPIQPQIPAEQIADTTNSAM